MVRTNDEIRGVLVPVGDDRILLPNATVAEVLASVPVQPVGNAPNWLSGVIKWHGWTVPLFSMLALSGAGTEEVGPASKIVVLKALSGSKKMPYVGLLTQSFPRLVSVPRDGLLADASEESLPQGVHMRLLLNNESALLPDLDAIEKMVAQAMEKSEAA